MKNYIEADAADTLAGLQVDLLQKFRSKNVTTPHLKWFLNLSLEERNKISGGDFFEYATSVHVTLPGIDSLISFVSENWGFKWTQTPYDPIFRSTTKVKAKIFHFSADNEPTPEQCIEFVQGQNGILPGVWGLAALFMGAQKTIQQLLTQGSFGVGLAGMALKDELFHKENPHCSTPSVHIPTLSCFTEDTLKADNTFWENWNSVRYVVYFCK